MTMNLPSYMNTCECFSTHVQYNDQEMVWHHQYQLQIIMQVFSVVTDVIQRWKLHRMKNLFKMYTKKHNVHRRLLFQRSSQSKGTQAQSLARSYRWPLNLIRCYSIELNWMNYWSFGSSILQKILHHLIYWPCYRLRPVCKRCQCHGGEHIRTCTFLITKQSLLILDQ